MHLFFNYKNHNSEARILAKNPVVEYKCTICSNEKWRLDYDELKLDMQEVSKIDLFYSGSRHSIVHESVVEKLLKDGITGCAFHPVWVVVEAAHLHDSICPKYYALEPVGRIGIHLPMDEGVICPHCGIFERKIFGSASKPLLFDWSSWDFLQPQGRRTVPKK
jgi:hypothetical protein